MKICLLIMKKSQRINWSRAEKDSMKEADYRNQFRMFGKAIPGYTGNLSAKIVEEAAKAMAYILQDYQT